MSKWLLSYDVASVLVFVTAGRPNHGAGETVTGILHTAGPFVIALVLGWVATRAWRDPASIRVGTGVLAVTVVVGMVLRRFAFDDGTQLSFVLVTTGFLSLFLLGWRLRGRGPPPPDNPGLTIRDGARPRRSLPGPVGRAVP